MYVYLCVHVHMCVEANKGADIWELKLQAVMSHQTWV